MIHCPRCQSPNAISNRFEEIHLERATNFAQATQSLGIKRLSVVAGLAALAFRGVNALFREYRCADCGYRYDG